ncbi:hypothetical protein E2C01_082983 [Portunus trituberculatus]|uniref:Secreted protein n=1 Tax=Portunus trituberculatus TaxID=210409 RepID=A0A5B7J0R1_PORTR|nr:hypothetical protein [Portunus trituberculatus]
MLSCAGWTTGGSAKLTLSLCFMGLPPFGALRVSSGTVSAEGHIYIQIKKGGLSSHTRFARWSFTLHFCCHLPSRSDVAYVK